MQSKTSSETIIIKIMLKLSEINENKEIKVKIDKYKTVSINESFTWDIKKKNNLTKNELVF